MKTVRKALELPKLTKKAILKDMEQVIIKKDFQGQPFKKYLRLTLVLM